MQLPLDTAREGHRLCTIAHDCLVAVLFLDAFSSGQVEEGEHGGYVGIVGTIDSQFFIAILVIDHHFHLVDDGVDDWGALDLGEMFRIKQDKQVVLYVFHLTELLISKCRGKGSP